MITAIKRQINKNKDLWKKARQKQTENDWKKSKDIRKNVKNNMKKAYEVYVGRMFQKSL